MLVVSIKKVCVFIVGIHTFHSDSMRLTSAQMLKLEWGGGGGAGSSAGLMSFIN